MWILRERRIDFRKKIVCKQFNDGLNKFYIEFIVFMYTQKIAIIFYHSRLGIKKKIIPKQNSSVAHLYTTLVFYKVNWTARNKIFCYKGRL